jgi:hypothetical protein
MCPVGSCIFCAAKYNTRNEGDGQMRNLKKCRIFYKKKMRKNSLPSSNNVNDKKSGRVSERK